MKIALTIGALATIVATLLFSTLGSNAGPRLQGQVAQQSPTPFPLAPGDSLFRGQTAALGAPAQGEPSGALYDLVVQRHDQDQSQLVTWYFGKGGTPSYDVQYTNAEPVEAGSGLPVAVAGQFYLKVEFFPARRALLEGDQATQTYTGPLRIETPDIPNIRELVFTGDFEGQMTWYIGMQFMAGFDLEVLHDPARVALRIYDPLPGISDLPVLGVGSSGPDVLALEQTLRERGYLDREADLATFDEALRQAVVAFQRDNGIVPNGRVGPETWAYLVGPEIKRAAGALYVPDIRSDGPLPTPTPTATAVPTPTPTPLPANSIYLTFDDGPNPTWTPQILDVLSRYGAHGTFFMVGEYVARYPSVARAVVAAGNAVGNHTYHHQDLTGVGLEQFFDEVRSTAAQIEQSTGVATTCLRPPYGATSQVVRDRAAQLGFTTVLWDIDPQDWRRPGASVIANHVISHARPGAIILLHDGGGDRSQTVEALGQILATLGARGYVFATLSC